MPDGAGGWAGSRTCLARESTTKRLGSFRMRDSRLVLGGNLGSLLCRHVRLHKLRPSNGPMTSVANLVFSF